MFLEPYMRAQDWACVRMHRGYAHKLIPACACQRLPWLYFSKNRFIFSLKVIFFHSNISQVNLTSDWALIQLWVLEFSIIGERGLEA